jgi:hypothetical protein
MPYDDPDPQDPMMFVGVEVPASREAQVEMAWAIAEEFARMGYGERQILDLFRRPFFAGAHRTYRDLGGEAVEAIVRETVGAWGRMRLVDRDAAPRAEQPEAEGQGHDQGL